MREQRPLRGDGGGRNGWLSVLLEAGTQHAPDPRTRRRLVVNNGIALVLLASGLGYAALLTAIGFVGPGLTLVPIALVYVLALWLNRAGRRELSNLVQIIAANTMIFGYLLWFGFAGEVSVFFATVALPLILCDLRDRRTIVFGFALSIGYAMVMAMASHDFPVPSPISAGAMHGLRVSLVMSTFAVMLAAILSFVVSNARAEANLDRARAGVQRLLDSVDQGFVTLDAKGAIGVERSRVFDDWFGRPPSGTPFAACLAPLDATASTSFLMGWSQIVDDLLPLEVTIAQLPRTLAFDGRHWQVAYRPECQDGRLINVLVVVSDVTAAIARDRAERQQRELLGLMGRFSRDRNGFREFLREADHLIDVITIDVDPIETRRALHTLKGNCALFGAATIAEHCHAVESRLGVMYENTLSHPDRQTLLELWRELRARMEIFVGAGGDVITVERVEIDELRRRARQELPRNELIASIEGLLWEPAARRLARVGEQLSSLAQRLGKGEIDVSIEDGGVRLEPARWAGFWAAFAHVVRNAIDHGLESPEERIAAGKGRARIALRMSIGEGGLALELADDGRGIDWAKVKAKAEARGLPAGTRAELEDAILLDDFSTREADEVSELSGRGVGLAAVRRATVDLGGTIAIDSDLGKGTRLRFGFPSRGNLATAWPASASSSSPSPGSATGARDRA